jgi:hypothetical protein
VIPSLLRAHFPLVCLGGLFLVLSAAHCTSESTENPPPNPSNDAGKGGAALDGASPRPCFLDNDCPLPPSTCQTGNELAYYTHPRCVASQCEWTREIRSCPSCYNGQCNVTTTAGGFPGTGGNGGAGGLITTTDAASDSSEVRPWDAATIDPPEGGVCEADAEADGGDCPLPPSVCADYQWLAYFVNPRCSTIGRCEWEVQYRRCIGICRGNTCTTNVTF